MKYIVRSLKYLLLISVLYVALLWVSSVYTYNGMVDVATLLKAQLGSERGVSEGPHFGTKHSSAQLPAESSAGGLRPDIQ